MLRRDFMKSAGKWLILLGLAPKSVAAAPKEPEVSIPSNGYARKMGCGNRLVQMETPRWLVDYRQGFDGGMYCRVEGGSWRRIGAFDHDGEEAIFRLGADYAKPGDIIHFS